MTSLRRRTLAAGLAFCGVSALVVGTAWAGPLDPDPSFAGDGSVRLITYGTAQTVAVHEDAIYAAGISEGAGSGEFGSWVRSYDSSGASVASWGYMAWCYGYFPANRDILATAGGDIIVVGYARGGPIPGYGYLLRLDSDLTPDSTWSDDSDLECATPSNGMRYLNTLDLTDVSSATLDSQGRIVIAGSIFGDFAVIRLLDDGTLDKTFGGSGVVRLRTLATGETSFDVATTSSDAVLVAGRSTITQYGSHKAVIVKLTEAGSLSNSWGQAGVRTFGHSYEQVQQLQVLEQGTVVAGMTKSYEVGVAQVLSDGTNDATFSEDGRLDVDCASSRWESALTDLTVHYRQAGGYRVQAYLQCKVKRDLVAKIGGWLDTGEPGAAFNDRGFARPPWDSPITTADVMSDSDTVAVMQAPKGGSELLVRLGTSN